MLESIDQDTFCLSTYRFWGSRVVGSNPAVLIQVKRLNTRAVERLPPPTSQQLLSFQDFVDLKS
jgi:hypothetical protein